MSELYANLYYDKYVQSFSDDNLFIKSFIYKIKPKAIADIGAGKGRLVDLYLSAADPILEIHLIEPFKSNYDFLNENFKDIPKIKVSNGNAYKTELNDNSCDLLIYGYGSFAESAPNIFTLNEANRVLKMGGYAVIWLANLENLGKLTHCLRSDNSDKNTTHSFYAKTTRFPDLGPFECRTEFWGRGDNKNEVFIIPQNFPSIPVVDQISKLNGFTLKEVLDPKTLVLATIESDSYFFILQKTSELNNKILPVTQDPTTQSNQVAVTYNNIASKYDDFITKANYGVIEFINKQSKVWINTQPRVLDVGCGSGIGGLTLMKSIKKPELLLGLDISVEMLNLARTKKIYNGLANCDINSESFPIEKYSYFDLILCLGVLEFIDNPFEKIRQFRERMVIGGELWVSFETTEHFQNITTDIFVDSVTYSFKKYAYSIDYLNTQLDKLGFDIIDMYSDLGYYSPTLNKNITYRYLNLRRNRT